MKKTVLLTLAALLISGTAGVAVAEDASSRYLQIVKKLSDLETPATAKKKVRAWVDHSDNTYQLGDPINLSVKANFDAYMSVFAMGPDGEMIRLYPNDFQPQVLVGANQEVIIPGKNAPVSIIAGGTPGNEHLYVYASSVPDALIPDGEMKSASAFRSVDGGGETLARYLALAINDPAVIEAVYDKRIKTVANSRNVTIVTKTEVTTEASSQATEVAVEAEVADEPTINLVIDKAEYAIGETVQMAITSPKDCYAWVVDVSADGSKHILFPNKLMQDNFLHGGAQLTLSGGDSPVKVVAQAPAGKETVYTLCSADPHAIGAISFAEMFPTADSDNNVVRALGWEPATTPPAIPDGIDWVSTYLVTK